MEQCEGTYRARSRYKDKEYAGKYDHTRYEENRGKQERNVRTKNAIVETLGRLSECKTILDMPCGTGRLAQLVIGAGYEYIGCDITKEMLDVALEKVSTGPGLQFISGDGEGLPFKDNSVDCVLCVRFLNLIPVGPRLSILREFHRVSKKYLVVSSGYFGPRRPTTEALGNSISWVFPKIAVRNKRHAGLRRELQEAGWQESFWTLYKSRGFFSTTKAIGVFTK